jgi:hypothetical protein
MLAEGILIAADDAMINGFGIRYARRQAYGEA